MPRSVWIKRSSRVALFVAALLAVPSCTSNSGTASPTYAHFVPTKGSLFQLEFDYPAIWTWVGDRPDDSYGVISVSETSESPGQTGRPGNQPNFDQGVITLMVEDVASAGFSPEQDAESFIDATKSNPFMEIVADRVIDIDGRRARQITTRVAPRIDIGQRVSLIDESVLLFAEQRYYRIGLQIPEQERQGPFGKGFDHLVSSIKIIP